jgi:magnesium-transporting ATPase (P-type)
MTHLLSRAARVVDPTFIDLTHVFRLEDRPTLEDGEARRSETASTLERSFSFWWMVCGLTIVTIVTIVVDCGIAWGFLGMSFQEMVALDMAVASEFSLWQSFVFLFVVPWALILSRSRDERRQVFWCCLGWILCCFFLMSFFFVSEKSFKWQQDASRGNATSKGIFDRFQQVVFDDVLYEECHENNKKRYNACVGYIM